MTRLAIRHNAVNLAQGFPDFPAPQILKDAARQAGDLTHVVYLGAQDKRDFLGIDTWQSAEQAMASIRKAGTVVVTALGNIADTTPIPISLADITLFQKRIQGAMFGMSNPNWDILRQLELYRSGVLKLDELITKSYALDDIQQGYQDMHDGKNIRGVIKYAS